MYLDTVQHHHSIVDTLVQPHVMQQHTHTATVGMLSLSDFQWTVCELVIFDQEPHEELSSLFHPFNFLPHDHECFKGSPISSDIQRRMQTRTGFQNFLSRKQYICWNTLQYTDKRYNLTLLDDTCAKLFSSIFLK